MVGKNLYIRSTVGKMPTVFLLGENMVYIRAAPSGGYFYAVKLDSKQKGRIKSYESIRYI